MITLNFSAELCVIDSFKIKDYAFKHNIMCLNGYQYVFISNQLQEQMFETYNTPFRSIKESIPIECSCWDKKEE